MSRPWHRRLGSALGPLLVRFGRISGLITISALISVLIFLVYSSTTLAGLYLLLSTSPVDRIRHCVEEYAHHQQQRHVSARDSPPAPSPPFFCSHFARPVTALVQYAQESLSADIDDIAFDFDTQHQDISSIHAVDISLSARYRFDPRRFCRLGDDCTSAVHKWGHFATQWFASEIQAVSPSVSVSLLLDTGETIPAASIRTGIEAPVPLFLDGREGQITGLPVQVSLDRAAIPEIAQILSRAADWITRHGPVGSESHQDVDNGDLQPPPIRLLASLTTDATILLGPSGSIPCSASNVTLTQPLTFSLANTTSKLTFTDLAFSVLVPAEDGALSILKVHAGAETFVPLPTSLPFALPALNISSIPPVQFLVSMPSNCPTTFGSIDRDALTDLANITVSLEIETGALVSGTRPLNEGIRLALQADSWIGGVTPGITKKCTNGVYSPLDHALQNYIRGEALPVIAHHPSPSTYSRGSRSSTTPQWIPDVLSDLAIPMNLPIPPSNRHLINTLLLENVKLELPRSRHDLLEGLIDALDVDAFSDGDDNEPSPQALIRIDVDVTAYINLPSWPYSSDVADRDQSAQQRRLFSSKQASDGVTSLDDILHVRFIRAPKSIVYFRGSELGILDISRWSTANSTVTNTTDGDHEMTPPYGTIPPIEMSSGDYLHREPNETNYQGNDPDHPYLKIYSAIRNAPLKVTNRRVLASLIKTLIVFRQPARMRIRTHIDAAVSIAGLVPDVPFDATGGYFPAMAEQNANHDADVDPDSLIVLAGIPALEYFTIFPRNVY